MKRCDIWIVNLEPGFGRELHKKRPALILTRDALNQATSSVVIVPASSQVPLVVGPEMVLIAKKEGVDKPSVLLPLFIRSIDQERLIKKIGVIDAETMKDVENALKLILGLS